MTTSAHIAQEFAKLFSEATSQEGFAAGGPISSEFDKLKIAVEGISEEITFPLQESQAKQLIQISSKSPFGRKEKTLYDEKVRSSWQLEPEQFQIKHPEWDVMMKALLTEKVMPGLGIRNIDISCSLYKMLIYEKGGHFSRHRDTEKEEGMFGTLVIQLPCDYKGGEMSVFHRNQEQKFMFNDTLKTSFFTCFYADCEHEVKEVTEGYRICLVYNLIYTGERKELSIDQDLHLKLNAIIKTWEPLQYAMVYEMEHQYSEFGLSLKKLKKNDMIAAEILIQGMKANLLDARLVILDKHERNYNSTGEQEIRWDAVKIITFDDKIDVASRDSLMSYYFEFFPERTNFESYEEEYGDTGNAGSTIERWYHTAALMFWPVCHSRAVWKNLGRSFELRQALNILKDKMASAEDVAFAKQLARERLNDYCDMGIMFEAVAQLKEEECLEKASRCSFKARSVDSLLKALRSCAEIFGEEIMKPHMASVCDTVAQKGAYKRDVTVPFFFSFLDAFKNDYTWLGTTVYTEVVGALENSIDGHFTRPDAMRPFAQLIVQLYERKLLNSLEKLVNFIKPLLSTWDSITDELTDIMQATTIAVCSPIRELFERMCELYEAYSATSTTMEYLKERIQRYRAILALSAPPAISLNSFTDVRFTTEG